MSRTLLLTAALVAAAAPLSDAQTLLGVDGTAAVAWEFSSAPGGPCGAPNPNITATPYAGSVCTTVNPMGFVQPGSLWGDIADNPLTNTYFVTDGFVVHEFNRRGPCGVPAQGSLVNSMNGAGITGAPILGMGMDPTGLSTGGIPALWFTDGAFVWAMAPSAPGSCAPLALVVPPCGVPTVGAAPLTDITVDSMTGRLMACDAAGFIHHFGPGCAIVMPPVFVGGCSGGALTGIAFDTSTVSAVTGAPPAAYVTDGFSVDYIDPFTGAPAAPTFYTPVNCFPTPGFLSGLALTQGGVEYGFSRANSRLTTFGQSSSPGPTFGLQIDFAPPGTNGFLILNFNFPGPGFFCPPLPGVGTNIWVDPTAPGTVIPLGPMGPGCLPIALPIPPAVPTGLQLFAQAVFIPTGGPPAADATNGIEASISAP